MRACLAYVKMAFKNNLAYRVDYIMGTLDTFLQIIISCIVWKCLFENHEEVNGVSYLMVTTNFILTKSLSNVFSFDDFSIPQKIWEGSISSELLKPIDLKRRILYENIGNILFNIIFKLFPNVIFANYLFGFLMPVNTKMFILFLVSIIFGMKILWNISLIVQMAAFWITNIWSVSVIKNVVIGIFSGALVPMWFLPEVLVKLIEQTPFYYIYFTSLQIYLGNAKLSNIVKSMLLQMIWIIILEIVSQLMWYMGKKRIVIQGG